MTKIVTAFPIEVDTGIYTVEAVLVGGKPVYHIGHNDGRYLTETQAERLADRVRTAGSIDMSKWYFEEYHRDEYALMEAEYYEG